MPMRWKRRTRPRWDSNPRMTDLQSVPKVHLGTRPEMIPEGTGTTAKEYTRFESLAKAIIPSGDYPAVMKTLISVLMLVSLSTPHPRRGS